MEILAQPLSLPFIIENLINGGSGTPSYWNQSEPTSHINADVAPQKYNGTEGLLQENAHRMVALPVLNYHVFRHRVNANRRILVL
jgi:hypothetical protein